MAQPRKTSKRTSGVKKTAKQAKQAKQAAKPIAKTRAKPIAKQAAKPIAKTRAKPIAKTAAKAAEAKGGAEHPTVAMVRGLAEIIEARGLSELIVDLPEVTLTLRRATEAVPVQQVAPAGPAISQMLAQPVAAPSPARPAEAPPAPAPAPAQDDHHEVTSPFVGTFYRRPNPDSSPYTEVGKRVQKGDVLCIIEAMKLMNEIEADISGTVSAVLVEDSGSVEYGQPLFKILPA